MEKLITMSFLLICYFSLVRVAATATESKGMYTGHTTHVHDLINLMLLSYYSLCTNSCD